MHQEDSKIPDRVTYSETRTVNLGNYESKSMFLSFSTNVVKSPFNTKAEIRESATVNVDGKDVSRACARAIKVVETRLDDQELIVRKMAKNFTTDIEDNEGKMSDIVKRKVARREKALASKGK